MKGGTGIKNCKKGKSCGGTCISSSKRCLVNLPGEPGSNGGKNLHDATGKVRDLVKARKGKGKEGSIAPGPTPQPQPNPQPQPTPQPQADATAAKTKKSQTDDQPQTQEPLKPERDPNTPGKDVWQSASKGDYSLVKKQTDRWAKEHGLTTLDGHDHAHTMIHSYMGVNSDTLARIGGGKKGDITPMEEGIVLHFDKAGRGRNPGDPVTKLTKEQIRENIAPMILSIGGAKVKGESQRSEKTIERAVNIIHNLQNRKDYGQFLDTITKAQSDIVDEAFAAL